MWGFLGKYWGPPPGAMGTAMHLRNKSNKDSTQDSQEAGSHLQGCLFAGTRAKGKMPTPRGLETTAGHSSKELMSSASEALRTKKITKAVTWGQRYMSDYPFVRMSHKMWENKKVARVTRAN